MKPEFKRLYDKITDPRVFICGEWYTKTTSGILLEFLEWFSSEYGDCLENLGKYYRVIAYPTTEIRNVPESGTRHIVKRREKTIVDPRAIKTNENKIPGTCSRPDIVARIMKKDFDEAAEKNRKHQEYLEFTKRKKEFMEGSKPDPFSFF